MSSDVTLAVLLPYIGLVESEFTAKGQLLVATGPGTYAFVDVGTDDQVLVADAAEATGVKWAAGGGGVSDHGGLTGLGDDDHTQYHTDARADTWLATKTVADISGAAADADLAAHEADTANPHEVTAAQSGADPAGTAATAVSTHAAEPDPHPGYVLESREGVADGVATLDSGGDVPLAQLGNVPAAPVSTVAGRTGDVVITSADLADVEATGARTHTHYFGAVNVTNTDNDSASDQWVPADDITITAVKTMPVGSVVAGANASTIAITGNAANLLSASTSDIKGGTVDVPVAHTLTGTTADLDIDAGEIVRPTIAIGETSTGGDVAVWVEYVHR